MYPAEVSEDVEVRISEYGPGLFAKNDIEPNTTLVKLRFRDLRTGTSWFHRTSTNKIRKISVSGAKIPAQVGFQIQSGSVIGQLIKMKTN